jgi:hypothetical protein
MHHKMWNVSIGTWHKRKPTNKKYNSDNDQHTSTVTRPGKYNSAGKMPKLNKIRENGALRETKYSDLAKL